MEKSYTPNIIVSDIAAPVSKGQISLPYRNLTMNPALSYGTLPNKEGMHAIFWAFVGGVAAGVILDRIFSYDPQYRQKNPEGFQRINEIPAAEYLSKSEKSILEKPENKAALDYLEAQANAADYRNIAGAKKEGIVEVILLLILAGIIVAATAGAWEASSQTDIRKEGMKDFNIYNLKPEIMEDLKVYQTHLRRGLTEGLSGSQLENWMKASLDMEVEKGKMTYAGREEVSDFVGMLRDEVEKYDDNYAAEIIERAEEPGGKPAKTATLEEALASEPAEATADINDGAEAAEGADAE